jgi:hypothetical protein
MNMFSSRKISAGSLEMSRLTLASLAVWLAVTGLMACNQTIPAASAVATSPAPEPVIAATAGPVPPVAAFDVDLAAKNGADEPEPRPEPPSVATVIEGEELALNQPVTVVEAAAVLTAAKVEGPASRFVFPADAGGELLAAKLTPPSQFEFRPVPFVSEPKPWRTLRFDPLPRDVASLTRTVIPNEPRTNPRAPLSGLYLHALDLPELPREIALSVPTPIAVHPQPLSYVSSSRAEDVPFLAVSAAPPKETLDAANDPARQSATLSLFQARLLTNLLPAPFIRLAIPEPFEQIRAVRLTYQLPDQDLSLFPAIRPSQPHFPVLEMPVEAKK